MDKKFLCVMAGYDDATSQRLQAMQDKLYRNGFYGSQTKNLYMHITLATFPTEREDDVKQAVKNASEMFGAFPVTFNHIGIFQGAAVLFVSPDCSKELLELKEAFSPSFNWTPHTTMLIDTPRNICSAVPIILEGYTAFEGKIDRIYLYEFQPPKHILTSLLK